MAVGEMGSGRLFTYVLWLGTDYCEAAELQKRCIRSLDSEVMRILNDLESRYRKLQIKPTDRKLYTKTGVVLEQDHRSCSQKKKSIIH